MCVVSAVHDYAGRYPTQYWDIYKWNELQKLMEAAKQFDQVTGQPNCVDPAKEKLVRDILDYLKQTGQIK